MAMQLCQAVMQTSFLGYGGQMKGTLWQKLCLAVLVGVMVGCIPRAYEPPRAAYEGPRDRWYLDAPVMPKPITGRATWYDATKNHAWYTRSNKWGKAVKLYAAAGPALRMVVKQKYMMKPFPIWVESVKTGVRVKVYVVDWCGCYGRKNDPLDTRLIDLAPAVWEKLGVPLGQGVMTVRITLQP